MPKFTYMQYVSDAASVAAFNRNEEPDSLISVEALPENGSLIDFKSFASDYPEKLFSMLDQLRPEFQELFIEYYILEKSQNFLARTRGCIQTRIWQSLRIIEQAIGSLIVLGPSPDKSTLFSILGKVGMDYTEYGSLANLITLYAVNRNYAEVAKAVGAPIPAIRKIFRPAITHLLASRNLQAAAVGCYLRSLTHQASLRGSGLSRRCVARMTRMKRLKFTAPPSDNSALLSFGDASALRDTPWNMFEINMDSRMSDIFPMLRKQGERLFKKAGQIFAPYDANGDLKLGYILARSLNLTTTRGLLRVRGISEMSAIYSGDTFSEAVTVPNSDVQELLKAQDEPKIEKIREKSYVKILTGEVSGYCGTVTKVKKNEVVVLVQFPSGRQFVVSAHPSGVQPLSSPLRDKRTFWGYRS